MKCEDFLAAYASQLTASMGKLAEMRAGVACPESASVKSLGVSPIGRAGGVSKILVNSPGVCGDGGCCAGATPVWKIFEKSGGGAGWAAGAGIGGGGAVPRFTIGVMVEGEGCCGIAWNI